MRTEQLRLLVEVKAMLREDASLPTLLSQYDVLKKVPDLGGKGRKLLAEVCYLVARKLVDSNEDQARAFANEAIALYEEMGIETLLDARPILDEHLPEIMHEGVVKERVLACLECGGIDR